MGGAYWPAATCRYVVAHGGGHLDPDGALEVGPAHLDPQLVQHGEDVGMRVSVAVVRADPDQADLGPDGAQERRVGGGRSVVRDRQHLGLEEIGPSQPVPQREQVLLGRRFRVAGEQHPAVGPGHEHDQRRVVEFAP
jgi:hypothetical protein